MALPPGLAFLLPNLPLLLAPPAAVYLAAYVAETYFAVGVPGWALALACVLSWPAALAAVVFWYDFKAAREAAARGARLPRQIAAKYPGSVDLMASNNKEVEDHVIGYRLSEFARTYGWTFNIRLLFQDRVFTAEPEYIKRILATDFNNYEKGAVFHAQMKSLLGSGVFNADGELWKFHRGMTRPFFSRDRISHFDMFDRHAEEALNHAKTRLAEGVAIDWQDLVSRFTLDSATEFLFGQDVRSLSAPLPYPPTAPQAARDTGARAHPANRFAHAFLEAQLTSARRSRYTAAWPLWEFWANKVDAPVRVMDEFVQPLLRDALARKGRAAKARAEEAVEDGATLLEHLVKLTDDPQIIRDETLNILLAGRDTTAITLTMAGYMLAEHPKILQRLRKEVLDTVGSRRPTYDDIRDMKYLRAFINEVLRMYPPVPFNVRFSTAPTVWPSPEGDIYIPAGTRCMYSVFIMHRRKDLWGPDADKFDPDRFLDERLSKYLTPNPFIFLPFNAGPRICLGQQFAYNEVSFMLIRLLQHVAKIELHPEVSPKSVPSPGWATSMMTDGQDKVVFKSHLTMYVQGGLWVTMDFEDPEEH
ncbi:cytochrome P450 [Phanerochaete sordida]|uniref:Cytochrome P450 n=1 Tax=Phanerochaete sordida TaxID=48140 RepID=A0A9P3LH27_9APHY|nr:cytochrome P450 [Phanerochaete sordida]